MSDPLRQEIALAATTIVVKVGTRTLTRPDGSLDEARIEQLSTQLHLLMETGRRVVLVSSGAVASGMGRLGLTERPKDLAKLQAVAAVGQSYLVQTYDRVFRALGRQAAQVLLTADDLDERARYLNVRNTLLSLLEFGAVPIINENDTVSTEELQTTFGDNDRLAAMVTNLIRAPLLVLLSDVLGLYDGDPRAEGSKLISTVMKIDDGIYSLVRDQKTGLSKGGMASKLNAARAATLSGENVIITSGKDFSVLSRIIAGESVGTLFLAQGQAITSWKRWIGFTAQPRGVLVLDDGARTAVEKGGKSLLAIGIVDVQGEFTKGDVVAVRDRAGVEFARGLSNYSAAEVLRIKGMKTKAIAPAVGTCAYQEVVRGENMAVTV